MNAYLALHIQLYNKKDDTLAHTGVWFEYRSSIRDNNAAIVNNKKVLCKCKVALLQLDLSVKTVSLQTPLLSHWYRSIVSSICAICPFRPCSVFPSCFYHFGKCLAKDSNIHESMCKIQSVTHILYFQVFVLCMLNQRIS